MTYYSLRATSNHLIATLAAMALLSLMCTTTTLQAQQPQEVAYRKAIDEINCAMVRELLISYDRPVLARNLYDCSYQNITTQIGKIKENTIKGYKKMITDAASDINNYKTKVSNPAEYSLFETALSDAKSLAVKRFEEVCSKNKGVNNSVCIDMDKRAIKLQSSINDVMNNALSEIAKNTYGGEKAPKASPPKTSQEAAAVEDKDSPTHQESAETAPDNSTNTTTAASNNSSQSTGRSSNFWGILQAALFIGLIAAVGWLYKENTELKEKLHDIEMLLKILNQRKS